MGRIIRNTLSAGLVIISLPLAFMLSIIDGTLALYAGLWKALKGAKKG